jgi:glutaminase
VQSILDEIDATIRASCERGQVASHVPRFDFAGGRCFGAADAGLPFSIQSVSRVFTFTMVLELLVTHRLVHLRPLALSARVRQVPE